MNLDRFSQGLPDIQDMTVVQHCRHCGDAMHYYRVYEVCDYCSDSVEISLESEEEYEDD